VELEELRDAGEGGLVEAAARLGEVLEPLEGARVSGGGGREGLDVRRLVGGVLVAGLREELGVNELTTPLVGKVFADLELFQPPPLDLVRSFDLKQSFPNRFQTSLQFGALVANGFVATISRQKQLIIDTGRALIREANTLSAGQRLTSRSRALFDLSERNDWQGLRMELNATQEDVEDSMLELKDGEMADLVSLGGWLRGFQLAAHVTADHYTPEKATSLVRPAVMDYFIARMDCLSPSMKKRPVVIAIASRLKTIRAIAVPGKIPTEGDVVRMRDLADEAMKAALSKDAMSKDGGSRP
jgi:hypothetical protein